jgi:hypothetical protein
MSYFEVATSYPYFYYKNSADQDQGNSTVFAFDTKVYDNGNTATNGNTVISNRFNAPQKGLYFINVTVSIINQSSPSSDPFKWGIYQTNSANTAIYSTVVYDEWESQVTTGIEYNKSLSSIFFMNSGDKIYVSRETTGSGTIQTLSANRCHFSGYLICPFS